MGPAIFKLCCFLFKNPWHPRFPMKLLGIEFNIKTLYLHYAYKGPAAREKENEALRARGVLHLHHTGSYQNVENDMRKLWPSLENKMLHMPSHWHSLY